jgi:hypothetical protein
MQNKHAALSVKNEIPAMYNEKTNDQLQRNTRTPVDPRKEIPRIAA